MQSRRKLALSVIAGIVSTAAVAQVQAEPRRFVIDPEHLSIGFLVEHSGYAATLGRFREARGELVYDEAANELESGQVTVMSESVFTDHQARDEHLRSAEFLDAEAHPKIRFEATGYEPSGERSGMLKGELSMLGRTRPVTMDVTINKIAKYPAALGTRKYTLGAQARTAIKRSNWGMTYAVENGLVGDEVELIIAFEATRQPE